MSKDPLDIARDLITCYNSREDALAHTDRMIEVFCDDMTLLDLWIDVRLEVEKTPIIMTELQEY